jgi:hypothetical protein
LTLLLNALNEIPSAGAEAVRLWKAFLAQLEHDYPGNRVVFSCRSLDYSMTLSSKESPVPQVRAEWEAATRGLLYRRYAYGEDFDAACCNTLETHIRRTTPIGVFPTGDTPEGLVDMSGNTWDWTGSLYQPYPYNADYGREDSVPYEARRVVRGGSAYYARGSARVVLRRLPSRHPARRSGPAGGAVVPQSCLISVH